MDDFIISIDQSTSATKCVLFDAKMHAVSRRTYPHETVFGSNGHVEHDGEEIAGNVIAGIEEFIRTAGPGGVKAIALSVQTGAFILWDRMTGLPAAPMIGWQDGRAAESLALLTDQEKDRLRQAGYDPGSGGIPLKLFWLLRNSPRVRELDEQRRLAFGTVDSWLVWKLTGGSAHACNYCNACIARLYDAGKDCWNREVLEVLGIREEILPGVLRDDDIFGYYLSGTERIPVTGIMGDSAAAMFGQRCLDTGDVKITYGTGASCLVNIGPEPIVPPPGLSLNTAWNTRSGRMFVWEGTVRYAGSILTWLIRSIGLDVVPETAAALAVKAGEDSTACLVPSFGSPEGAVFAGLTLQSTAADMVRAALECVCFDIAGIMESVKEHRIELPARITVDGGGSRNSFEMQFQADLLGIPLCRSSLEEGSVTGAAWMAGLAAGLFAGPDALPPPVPAVGQGLSPDRTDRDETPDGPQIFVPGPGRAAALKAYDRWLHYRSMIRN